MYRPFSLSIIQKGVEEAAWINPVKFIAASQAETQKMINKIADNWF